MTTSRSNLVELAKQGNPKAIAALMNRHLQSKGITAKATLKDYHLQIILESQQLPNQQSLVSFIHKSILSLAIPSVQIVKIYGRQIDEELPGWMEELEITEAETTSIQLPLLVETHDNQKNSSQFGGVSSQPILQPNKPNILVEQLAKFQKLPQKQKAITVVLALLGILILHESWNIYWKLHNAENGSSERFRQSTEDAQRKYEEAERRLCESYPDSSVCK